jgi:hypothetical protein
MDPNPDHNKKEPGGEGQYAKPEDPGLGFMVGKGRAMI